MSDRRQMANAPGRYDYPPAAADDDDNSVPAYDFDAIPPRLQYLRRRLDDERFRAAFDFEHPTRSTGSPPSMPHTPTDSESQNRMRSVLRAIHENEGPPPSGLALPPATVPSQESGRPNRRHARPSQRFQRLNDQRSRLSQEAENASDNTFDLHEASERLARSNEGLRSLLDRPLQSTGPRTSRFLEADDSLHYSESQHRRKRRRTDGPVPTKRPPIRKVEYGYRGQAWAGPLEMEARHVDNGDLAPTYDLADGWMAHDRRGAVASVLRDDSSVYTETGRRCNLILQHPGERAFTMKRVVIKIPDMIDDDYFVQGLAFTSREIDDAFDRTAHYQMHDSSGSRFSSQSRLGPMGLRTRLQAREAHGASANHVQLNQLQREVEESQQVPAECDADSLDSEDSMSHSDDGSEDRSRSSPMLDEDSDSSTFSEHVTGPARHDEHSGPPRSRLREGMWREFPGRQIEDDDEHPLDPEVLAAQFDFDEVLRRGAEVSTDRRRRRRAVTRERVRQRLAERNQERVGNRHGNLSTANLLETVEPPARPEDPRWPQPSQSSRSDPPPLYSRYDIENPYGEGIAYSGTNPNLLEPAAYFSSGRQVRLRYPQSALKPSADPIVTDPALENEFIFKDRVNDEGSVTVNYRAKSYGGRISIDFETPISARYVMLKLWKSRRPRASRTSRNERQDPNVRLTRVRVEGWCGPRWFPAVDLA